MFALGESHVIEDIHDHVVPLLQKLSSSHIEFFREPVSSLLGIRVSFGGANDSNLVVRGIGIKEDFFSVVPMKDAFTLNGAADKEAEVGCEQNRSKCFSFVEYLLLKFSY